MLFLVPTKLQSRTNVKYPVFREIVNPKHSTAGPY